MKTNKEALKDLLYEFDDLCRENGIQYSPVGAAGRDLIENGALMEDYRRIRVMMPHGEIRKLISALENSPKQGRRKLEYAGNNSHAVDFRYRYVNLDSGFVNLIDCDTTEDYGAFLVISEIEKADHRKEVRSLKRKLERENKKTGLKARLTRKSSIRKITGKKDSLVSLENWEDVFAQEYVRVEDTKLQAAPLKKITEVAVDGHVFEIREAILGRLKKANHSKGLGYFAYDIDMPEFSSEELKKMIPREKWEELLAERRKYEDNFQKAVKASKEIDHAFDTYLMTKDIVEIRKLLAESPEISEELAERYAGYVKANRRRKVEYIREEALEEAIKKMDPRIRTREQEDEAETASSMTEDDEA